MKGEKNVVLDLGIAKDCKESFVEKVELPNRNVLLQCLIF